MIELLFNTENFRLTLLRKRRLQVTVDNVPPVADTIKQGQIQNIRHDIQHPQREQRKHVPRGKDYIIYKFHSIIGFGCSIQCTKIQILP